MKHLLFVYGTLKRGRSHHALLAGAEFVGEAETPPQFRLYHNGRHPCLVEAPADGVAVRGEVWRVDAEMLDRLDVYEAVPDPFARLQITLPHLAEPVFVYLYHGPIASLEDCGTSWPPA